MNSVVMPGSISKSIFIEIISNLREKYCINNPETWINKAHANKLDRFDICFTFDDTIKSQFIVAKDILDSYKIRAFFFVYTGMFHNYIPRLEVYRYFISKYYCKFEQFFGEFLEIMEEYSGIDLKNILEIFPENYLRQFSFYSPEERLYRFIRDKILRQNDYMAVMDKMIASKTSLANLIRDNLWMSPDQIWELTQEGHFIGLHSVSHPTDLGERSDFEQEQEYMQNKSDLEEITGKEVVCVAYPSGSYNHFTISLMKKLGMKIGFKTGMSPGQNFLFDIPRLSAGDLIL
jgi:peptidoglycan/xylan/chitin deacetylase (PgdA/CDA1 family)